MKENKPLSPRPRRSLFGPLLLIAIGLAFLFSNLKMLPGDFWQTAWRLWPVILIVIGLDNLWQREGIVGATLLIGAGAIFLMGNFALLAVDPWQVMIRLWPVLLIAVGFDIIVGRRSLWASLVGAVLILAILAGALWFIGVRAETGSPLTGQQISQAPEGATQARLRLEAGAGSFLVDDLQGSSDLIAGDVAYGSGRHVIQDFQLEDGTAVYTLRDSGVPVTVPSIDGSKWTWDLALSPSLPIDLTTSMGAGNLDVDLSELQISGLNVNLGVGQTIVTLPADSSFSGQISQGIGELVIYVPEGVGVRIDIDAGLVSINLPGDNHSRDIYESPGFATAEYQVELEADLGIGDLRVVQQ